MVGGGCPLLPESFDQRDVPPSETVKHCLPAAVQRPEMTLRTFKRELKANLFQIWCAGEQKEHSPSPCIYSRHPLAEYPPRKILYPPRKTSYQAKVSYLCNEKLSASFFGGKGGFAPQTPQTGALPLDPAGEEPQTHSSSVNPLVSTVAGHTDFFGCVVSKYYV